MAMTNKQMSQRNFILNCVTDGFEQGFTVYDFWNYLQHNFGKDMGDENGNLIGVDLDGVTADLELRSDVFEDVFMRMFDKGELTTLDFQNIDYTVDRV